jgi:competence protein ComEA
LVARQRRLLAVWALLVAGLAVRAFADGLLAGRAEQPRIAPITIDLNRAGLGALQALPGIGAVRAEAILLDRVRNGPFRAIEDLDRVDGVGATTIDELRPFASAAHVAPPAVR